MLRESGIPVTDTLLARTRAEATKLAQQMGLPVVLKVVSPEVTHKSDVGGVKVGLDSLRQVRSAFDSIVSSTQEAVPSASILGVSVQKMADPGVEIIIGASKDPQFGHVIMFGLGGVLVEILKDVSLRLVPLTPRDAPRDGARDQEPSPSPGIPPVPGLQPGEYRRGSSESVELPGAA